MERNYAALLIVVVALIGVVYLGGAIEIGGKPLFGYIDSAIGTTVFMGIHNSMMNLVSKDNTPKKEDPFTKVQVDFKEVLKRTSE